MEEIENILSGLRENILVKLDHDVRYAQMVGLWERHRKTLAILCLRGAWREVGRFYCHSHGGYY